MTAHLFLSYSKQVHNLFSNWTETQLWDKLGKTQILFTPFEKTQVNEENNGLLWRSNLSGNSGTQIQNLPVTAQPEPSLSLLWWKQLHKIIGLGSAISSHQKIQASQLLASIKSIWLQQIYFFSLLLATGYMYLISLSQLLCITVS